MSITIEQLFGHRRVEVPISDGRVVKFEYLGAGRFDRLGVLLEDEDSDEVAVTRFLAEQQQVPSALTIEDLESSSDTDLVKILNTFAAVELEHNTDAITRSEAVSAFVEGYRLRQRELLEQLKELQKGFAEAVKDQLRKAMGDPRDWLLPKDYFAHIQRQFQEQYRDSAAKLSEWLDYVPPERVRGVLTMYRAGWLVSMSMPYGLIERIGTLNEQDRDELDKAMCRFFSDRIDEMEEDMIETFPHRAEIVRAAFNAHRRGEYVCAVPLFLSQSDGMCFDLLNVQLFSKERGSTTPKTKKARREKVSDADLKPYLAPLVSPLDESAPIMDRHTLVDLEKELNRHAILHGLDVNYGTEQNSLKAMSVANWVATVVATALKRSQGQ